MKNRQLGDNVIIKDPSEVDSQINLETYAKELSLEILRLHRIILQNSHDLSNSIMGLNLQLKAFELKGEIDKKAFEKLQTSLQAIAEYINQSKHQYIEGREDSYLEGIEGQSPKNISELIEQVYRVFQVSLDHKNINLECKGDPDLEVPSLSTVFFVRVIQNLIGNAIKFSKAGSSIYLSFHPQKDVNVLSIQDEGKGVPKQIRDLVARKNRPEVLPSELGSNGEKGSGLGLNSVLDYLESNNIKWEMRSGSSTSLGLGTEFLIFIPNKLSNDSE